MRLRHKTRWAIVLVAALLALVSYSAVASATDVVPTIPDVVSSLTPSPAAVDEPSAPPAPTVDQRQAGLPAW